MITIESAEKEFTKEEQKHYIDFIENKQLYKGWRCDDFDSRLGTFVKKGCVPLYIGIKSDNWKQWVYLEAIRRIDEIESLEK